MPHASICLEGAAGRWLGISTYMAMSPTNPNGDPSVGAVAVDQGGATHWQKTFSGEDFSLEPSAGTQLAVGSPSGTRITDVVTGQSCNAFHDWSNASYVDRSTLVAVNMHGGVSWLEAEGAALCAG